MMPSQKMLTNSSQLEVKLALLQTQLMDEALGKRIDKCLTVPDLLLQLDPWGIVGEMMKLVDAVRECTKWCGSLDPPMS